MLKMRYTSKMIDGQKQMPANIVLEKWADIGFTWQGMVDVREFERLAQQLDTTKQGTDECFDVAITLKKEQGVLWLSYQVKAVLWLVCQRCLSPLAVDVLGDYRLAILKDESQITQIDDAEFVLIDELCIGDGRQMLPLKTLLEDELLLALPLAPRHDDCQMLLDSVGGDTQDETDDGVDNPFAVLAQLKADLTNKN